MSIRLIDSHLHLDDSAFDADRELVVRRALDAGVTAMVTVGTTLSSSRAAVALAERYPEVYTAVAVHPHEAGDATEETLAALRVLAGHPKVVGIGETGLDFARPEPPRAVQERMLQSHIVLSRDMHLPLIIHCREAPNHAPGLGSGRAFSRVLDILQEWNVSGAVMHAFSGTPDIATRCIERGHVISLAGPVTFRNARVPVDVAKMVPLASLLVETDAPVLAPVPFRGRRNEPAYLRYTVTCIAELKGMPDAEVAQATSDNARRIFRMRSA